MCSTHTLVPFFKCNKVTHVVSSALFPLNPPISHNNCIDRWYFHKLNYAVKFDSCLRKCAGKSSAQVNSQGEAIIEGKEGKQPETTGGRKNTERLIERERLRRLY